MASVQITFECIPLRSVGRLDIPLDASSAYRARCARIQRAIDQHGQHNAYQLVAGVCEFRLTNHESIGLLRFEFEGTVLTDATDTKTRQTDLSVELAAEACDWLTRDVSDWFVDTVRRAVAIEFDRYIAAGDLTRAKERAERLQAESNAIGGFLGMGL